MVEVASANWEALKAEDPRTRTEEALMSKRSRFAAVWIAAALFMGAATPALAHGPMHQSCKGFGELFAYFAQNPDEFGVSNAGEGISFNARNEVELFGQTFTPPGSIAAIVRVEHAEFCDTE